MGPRGYGLLFAFNTLLIVILQIPLVNWISQYSNRVGIALGAFLIGGGLALMTLSNTVSYVILSSIIWTLGEIIFFPLIQVTIFNYASASSRTFYMSLYQFTYAGGIMFGPFGGSLIYHYANANVLWWVCGLLGLMIMLIFLSLPKNNF